MCSDTRRSVVICQSYFCQLHFVKVLYYTVIELKLPVESGVHFLWESGSSYLTGLVIFTYIPISGISHTFIQL